MSVYVCVKCGCPFPSWIPPTCPRCRTPEPEVKPEAEDPDPGDVNQQKEPCP